MYSPKIFLRSGSVSKPFSNACDNFSSSVRVSAVLLCNAAYSLLTSPMPLLKEEKIKVGGNVKNERSMLPPVAMLLMVDLPNGSVWIVSLREYFQSRFQFKSIRAPAHRSRDVRRVTLLSCVYESLISPFAARMPVFVEKLKKGKVLCG